MQGNGQQPNSSAVPIGTDRTNETTSGKAGAGEWRPRTVGRSTPSAAPLSQPEPPEGITFWRAEGSLVNLTAVRPVAFFTWNAQRFSERWQRRGGMALLALIRPLLYSINRVAATRVLHTLLRGISQDRLDLLGEEYFQYRLLPRLKPKGVAQLREALRQGERIVLVSQGLDHVMRPLARHLGVELLLANRLEFRDGLATGRLETPVIRPRQILARIIGRKPNGRVKPTTLVRNLGYQGRESRLWAGIEPAERQAPYLQLPQILFHSERALAPLPMGQTYRGKSLLLIGFTGFIGKVWVAKATKAHTLDHDRGMKISP